MTLARNSRDFTFDYNLRLKDAGLVAASAAAQVGGVDKILDLGAGRVDGRIILDISAIETDTGNEKYIILAQVSSSATMASAIFNAGACVVGDSSTCLETVDSVASRREIGFSNEVNGAIYRYLRLYTQVAGTIATGINYTGIVVH